jgi:hypothetical protein
MPGFTWREQKKPGDEKYQVNAPSAPLARRKTTIRGPLITTRSLMPADPT